MIAYEKENNGFSSLLNFINKKYDEKIVFDLTFNLIYDTYEIIPKYDTMYETDNGLYDEDGFEEYNAIAFLNISTNELFEVNYLNLPHSVTCANIKIF